MFKLYDTLSRRIKDFAPLNPPQVTIYACGPTVYDYAHIGHMKKYVGDDILRRTLLANGFKVRHVMNITDVGHLVSDGDEGDDKLEKGAQDRNESVWEVAKFFEQDFFASTTAMNIQRPDVVARATEHINEQIKLIQILEKKGFIYQTEEAIYFDTAKLPDYGKLTGQKMEEKQVGVRGEVRVDVQKKHPADFVLWFFTVGRFFGHVMRWDSPWGSGFPGWHIECSAMSMEYLGNTLDIHTGGIDHIPVHHTNELAQSEAATGQEFVRLWVHHNFLRVEGEKMSKSKKNFYRVEDIIKRGFDPLALRYLFLTAHYRDELNFTWESLEAAQKALNNLREIVREWNPPKIGCAEFENQFQEALNSDLNTAKALAILWEVVHSDYPTSAKAETVLKFDRVLGLNLDQTLGQKIELSEQVRDLVAQREQARANRDYQRSDELRQEIKKLGFEVLDTPEGSRIKKL